MLLFLSALQRSPLVERATHLEADGADVVVLVQLLRRGSGQRVDLFRRFPPEQEALPAGLGSEPHVEVRVDDDDGGAHPAPLAEQRLPGAVGHHAQRHQKLQHPADGVHPVDDLVQALDRVAAEQLHHEEAVDQHGACDLGKNRRRHFLSGTINTRESQRFLLLCFFLF